MHIHYCKRQFNIAESYRTVFFPLKDLILLLRFRNEHETIEIQSEIYLNESQRSLPVSSHLVDDDRLNNTKPSKYRVVQQFFTNRKWYSYFYEKSRSKFTVNYLRNNLERIICIILYILINLGLSLYVIVYRSTVTKSNVLIVFARIGEILLNFNCTLVIILMLKYTILMLRMNKDLRKWIPLDDHIDFHKFVGRFITVLAIFHTISHMANFGRRTEHSWSTFMFTTYPDIGWIGGFTPLSGIILCIILAIIIICSMKWIRHGGHFQVFYWTHLLYLAFYIVLIVHARVFWKWIIAPFTLFVLEKIYSNLTRYSSDNGRTYILSVTIEPSNVICLYIHRPKNFRFKAGDYISINLPRIALYEYHPFTISSAPEEMSYLSVHIQASGNWTKRVYQRFKDMSDTQNVENDLIIHRADLNIDQATAEERQEREIIYCEEGDDDNERIVPDSRVHAEVAIIKGPYSSCARCVFDYKHVVLIGGGIGITPYASILQSLMAQFRASHIVCKHCQGHNYNRRNILENRFLKKVDFI
ncbi:unnamed protein product, partial [Adineta steineri]